MQLLDYMALKWFSVLFSCQEFSGGVFFTVLFLHNSLKDRSVLYAQELDLSRTYHTYFIFYIG